MQFHRKDILEAGAKFLGSSEIQSRLPQQLRDDIAAGRKQYRIAIYFHRKKLAGMAGIVKLNELTEDKAAGITRLDKGKLPEGTFMAILGVGLNYGYHATATEVTAVRYANSDFIQAIPAKLENTEFKLKNGDATVLETPTKLFFSKTATNANGTAANFENLIELPQPVLADSKKAFEGTLEFAADSVAVPSGVHFTELLIVGVEIADRVLS